MLEKTIKQHYVPQSYLENWKINKKSKKPKVFTLDLKRNKIFPCSITDIANSNYLYSINNDFRHIKDILFNIPELINIDSISKIENIFEL